MYHEFQGSVRNRREQQQELGSDAGRLLLMFISAHEHLAKESLTSAQHQRALRAATLKIAT